MGFSWIFMGDLMRYHGELRGMGQWDLIGLNRIPIGDSHGDSHRDLPIRANSPLRIMGGFPQRYLAQIIRPIQTRD